jgi:hypothetical protein
MCKFCRAEIEGARDRREALHPLHRRPEADPAEPAAATPKNPLPWMDQMLNAIEHINFFENCATEYSNASTLRTT